MLALNSPRRLEVLALASASTEPYVATALAIVARRVRVVADARALMRHAWEHLPDVIIVEGQVGDVATICRQVRRFFQTPIMVVVDGASEGERISWLDSGADDLLATPTAGPAELAARCKALLRRAQRQQRRDPSSLRMHALGMQLDIVGRRLYLRQRPPLDLSATHTRMLALLFSQGGGVVPPEALAEHLAGATVSTTLRRLPVLVQGLNRRLGECQPPAPCVERVRGSGYRLALNEVAPDTPLA